MDMRFEGLAPVGGGVWAPTTIKVYNGEGKLGAVSRQTAIRVNRGVSMSEFEL